MADRAWLWLAPYHDGKARAMAGQPGQSSATGRRRWFLPRPPWLRRALASIGAEETLGDHSGKRLPREDHVRPPYANLLVQVTRGVQCHGSMTPWDREAMLLWAYNGMPYDAFSLNVGVALKFSRPVQLTKQERFRSRHPGGDRHGKSMLMRPHYLHDIAHISIPAGCSVTYAAGSQPFSPQAVFEEFGLDEQRRALDSPEQ